MQIPSTLCSVAPLAPPTSVPHPLPHLHHVAPEHRPAFPRAVEQCLAFPSSPRWSPRYRGRSWAIPCEIRRVKVRCHMTVQVGVRGEEGGGGLEGRRERVPVALQEVISAPPTAALSWPLEEHPAEGKGADRDHRFPGRQRPAPARTMAPWRWQFPTEEPRRSDANHTRLRQLAGGADA